MVCGIRCWDRPVVVPAARDVAPRVLCRSGASTPTIGVGSNNPLWFAIQDWAPPTDLGHAAIASYCPGPIEWTLRIGGQGETSFAERRTDTAAE